MIISHTHRFIFLKTAKTAGTSIEIALSKFCGQADIVTPISPDDEFLRNDVNGRGPQNFLVPFGRYTASDWWKLLTAKTNPLGGVGHAGRLRFWPRSRARYTNHTPAIEIRARIKKSQWNSYFKFCFVRNPWDKVVSRYFFAFREEPRPTISAAVKSGSILASDFGIYTINDELVVDFVGRYESLATDLDHVSQMIGLQSLNPLPRAKTGFRKDRRSYREILSEAERWQIAKAFSKEIQLFGYEW